MISLLLESNALGIIAAPSRRQYLAQYSSIPLRYHQRGKSPTSLPTSPEITSNEKLREERVCRLGDPICLYQELRLSRSSRLERFDDRAIWELMYFGKARPQGLEI